MSRVGGRRSEVVSGAAAGLTYAVASLVLGVSFGVVSRPLMGPIEPIVMSAIVFAGSAQFAALAVVGGGGGALAAILAGVLLNLRYVPMGVAIAPSLTRRPWRRAMRGQTLVDASWVLAGRDDGGFDIDVLLGATLVQYAAWVGGTALGVLAGGILRNPNALGLDTISPAFFLGLLVPELRKPGAKVVAPLGAAVALALIPFVPPGIPIIAASLCVLLGLRR